MSGRTLYLLKVIGYSLQTIHSQIVRSRTWGTYAQKEQGPCTWKVWKETFIQQHSASKALPSFALT